MRTSRIVTQIATLYHQTNHYTWADGRTEVRDFPALIRDGRLDRRTLIDEERVSENPGQRLRCTP